MKPRSLAAKLAAYPVSRLVTRQEAKSLFEWLKAKGASNPRRGVLVLKGAGKTVSFTFTGAGQTKAHVRAEIVHWALTDFEVRTLKAIKALDRVCARG